MAAFSKHIVTNETHVGRSPAGARTDDIYEKPQLSSSLRRIWRSETRVLSVLPHSSHNSKGLTVREYVMSREDVSEMGDRPHALGGWNTSDRRTARRPTYRGNHRVFRCVSSICW